MMGRRTMIRAPLSLRPAVWMRERVWPMGGATLRNSTSDEEKENDFIPDLYLLS